MAFKIRLDPDFFVAFLNGLLNNLSATNRQRAGCCSKILLSISNFSFKKREDDYDQFFQAQTVVRYSVASSDFLSFLCPN
jgi:hypothetical protein